MEQWSAAKDAQYNDAVRRGDFAAQAALVRERDNIQAANEAWHRAHGTGPYASGGASGGSAAASAVPASAFSASQMLENLLKSAVGVAGLGSWASDLYNRGASPTEIVQAIRYGTDTSPAGQDAYRKYLDVFPGMDEFLKEGIFAGESPELQYINYRNTVGEAAERYGVNSDLVSKTKIADYIRGRNSAAELVDRMSMAASAISTTPSETYAVLEEYYGVTGKDLMAFYLDTDETEQMLKKRYTAARLGTEAARNQFGVDAQYAENLVERGVTLDEAATGFEQAAAQRNYTRGRGDYATSRDLYEAQFGNVDAQQQVARVAQSRVNAFNQGGQYVGEATGVSGLTGSSR